MEKYLLIFLINFVLFFSACTEDKNRVETKKDKDKKEFNVVEPPYDTTLPDKEGLKNTIKAYNYAVTKALVADPYFPLVRKYATDKETQRVFIDMNADTERGVAMRSWLNELIFKNISVADRSGYVNTTETWDFEFVDIKSKEVVEPKKTIRYKLKYRLEREDNKRVVAKITETEPTAQVVGIPVNDN